MSHVPEEELVLYAAQPEAMAAGRRAGIEAHLRRARSARRRTTSSSSARKKWTRPSGKPTRGSR